MRRTILFGALAAFAFTATVAAPSMASAPEPTCLLSTSIDKTTVCAELLTSGEGRTGQGTYLQAGEHLSTLTVTVEYTALGDENQPYEVLSSSSVTGTGRLSVATPLVSQPGFASLMRACATASRPNRIDQRVCTAD